MYLQQKAHITPDNKHRYTFNKKANIPQKQQHRDTFEKAHITRQQCGDNDPEPSRGVPRGDAAFGCKSSNPAQHTQLALWEAHNPPLRRPELPTPPCISGYFSLGRGSRGESGVRLLRVHRYHPRWIPSNHLHPMPASLPWVLQRPDSRSTQESPWLRLRRLRQHEWLHHPALTDYAVSTQ